MAAVLPSISFFPSFSLLDHGSRCVIGAAWHGQRLWLVVPIRSLHLMYSQHFSHSLCSVQAKKRKIGEKDSRHPRYFEFLLRNKPSSSQPEDFSLTVLYVVCTPCVCVRGLVHSVMLNQPQTFSWAPLETVMCVCVRFWRFSLEFFPMDFWGVLIHRNCGGKRRPEGEFNS
jgi:hypothetical protein